MPAQKAHWQSRSRRRARAGLLGPGLLLMAVLSIAPLVLVIAYAFMTRGRFGGVVPGFSLDSWARVLEPIYLGVLWNSIVVATITTLLALAIGFPVAFVISRLPPQWRMVALVAVVLPFWTNFLIRTYAWVVLLNDVGPMNKGLAELGVISEPLGLLYSEPAVIIGLLYSYLPLMILPIYASLSSSEREIAEAASDLGARPWRVFRDVYIPLSVPGIILGGIFVFVPSIGNFVIPDLMGGGKSVLLGNVIRDQYLTARDWPFGSVLILVMLAILVALFAAQAVASRRLTGKLTR